MDVHVVCFFFFKQKTAYEMRISDWSSDVCSSDLAAGDLDGRGSRRVHRLLQILDLFAELVDDDLQFKTGSGDGNRVGLRTDSIQIGRSSCRASVCPYV